METHTHTHCCLPLDRVRTADIKAKLQRVWIFLSCQGYNISRVQNPDLSNMSYHSTCTYPDLSVSPSLPTSISHKYQIQALFLWSFLNKKPCMFTLTISLQSDSQNTHRLNITEFKASLSLYFKWSPHFFPHIFSPSFFTFCLFALLRNVILKAQND